MADEYFEKTLIFVRFGKGLKQYPFSFVELKENTGKIIGSGMSPDGDMAYQELTPVTDTTGIAQINKDMMIDPDFLYRNTLATGVMYNAGQF